MNINNVGRGYNPRVMRRCDVVRIQAFLFTEQRTVPVMKLLSSGALSKLGEHYGDEPLFSNNPASGFSPFESVERVRLSSAERKSVLIVSTAHLQFIQDFLPGQVGEVAAFIDQVIEHLRILNAVESLVPSRASLVVSRMVAMEAPVEYVERNFAGDLFPADFGSSVEANVVVARRMSVNGVSSNVVFATRSTSLVGIWPGYDQNSAYAVDFDINTALELNELKDLECALSLLEEFGKIDSLLESRLV